MPFLFCDAENHQLTRMSLKHGVEAYGLDLIKIFSPALRAGGVNALEHGSARLAAAVPHRHRIEGIAVGGQSALRLASRRKLSEQKNTDRGLQKSADLRF